jgi:hypothetical protein
MLGPLAMHDTLHQPNFDFEATLRLFQARPHLFLGAVTLERVQVWLGGFEAAAAATRVKASQGAFSDVLRERGWQESGHGPVPEMRQKGLSDEQIMNELIDIEIEICRRGAT